MKQPPFFYQSHTMKFLLFFVFVVLSTASTLYQNKNINVNDDGTILITGDNGKKIVITRPTGQNGQKNVDISVTGNNGVTKKIQINDQNDFNLKIDDNHQNTWSSVNSLDDELRSKRGSKSQADVLCDILKDYQGINNDNQYNKLLQQINNAVQNGLVNPKIYDLLVDLNQNHINGDETTGNILDKVYENKILKVGNQGKKGVSIDSILSKNFYNNLLRVGQSYNTENFVNGLGQQVLAQRGLYGDNVNTGRNSLAWYGNNNVRRGLNLGYSNNLDGLTNTQLGVNGVGLLLPGINGGVYNQLVLDDYGQLRVIGGYGNNNQVIGDSYGQITGDLNSNQGYNEVVVDSYGNLQKVVDVTQVGNQIVYQTVPVTQRVSIGQSLLNDYLLGRQRGLDNGQRVVNDRFLELQQGIY